MIRKFTYKHLIQPFTKKWLKGLFVLLLWTLAFIALPAISGWFLAMCSLIFITASIGFSYLIPSAIIRLLAIFRTVTRYFERLENHKTTLVVQQSLQLKIFQAVAKLPYFKKQENNNSKLLENSTHGVDQVLNHILLWLLPLSSLIISLLIYTVFVSFFSSAIIGLEFLVSASILLFLVPQLFFHRSRKYYNQLKIQQEENNHDLMQSFRGRIEISKYKMEEKAISQYEKRLLQLENTESKLQHNSFYLQMVGGLGFSFLAAFIICQSSFSGVNAEIAIGIFFGIMAQAELAEILFSGKSERAAVYQHMKDIHEILEEKSDLQEFVKPTTSFHTITISNLSAKIPNTEVKTTAINFEIEVGDWIALYGETGKGKTTFLNSLFYPEYQNSGSITWNNENIPHLSSPECVYVTQKAYLLTGTLRENFQSYNDKEIEEVLEDVDLSSWLKTLPNGLNTWIGEHGESLSGGQRKKMLLAQALLKKPQLLVVDEPTAGISTENAIEIFQHIRQKYPKMSILMATHLKDFKNIVSKVVWL